jgi:hypothetical protein
MEFDSETLNRFAREAEQFAQRVDNGGFFPVPELSKRYLSGDVSFYVRLNWEHGINPAGLNFPWIMFTRAFHPCDRTEANIKSVDDDHQFSMLVHNVHLVNEPKEIVRRVASTVRLQTFDSSQRVCACDPLYFSTVTAKFLWLRDAGVGAVMGRRDLIDREFDLLHEPDARFGRRELPRNMIETRSEVMDNFTAENCEARLNSALDDVLFDSLERFTILVGPNWLLPLKVDLGHTINESGDFPIQIEDIFVGPV